MRIAYVTIADPADRHAWSGINHTLARRLGEHGVEVVPVGPLKQPAREFTSKLKTLLAKFRPGGGRYLWTSDPRLLRAYGREVGRRLRDLRCDLVFSPGTQPIAYLDTDLPVAFWTDAPFAAMHGYYPWYQRLGERSHREGMNCDTRALRHAGLGCYTSDWAVAAAVDGHGADPSRVMVLPFGANLDNLLDNQELLGLVEARQRTPWRFLFVGVEWERKGGDLALAVVRELNERGQPAELVVAGCQPPAHLAGNLPPYVKLEGFVSQHTPEGRQRLETLFRTALFYLMPSRAEAFGIVFCEASAHGVPSLSAATGGVPTIVENGRNGQLFAPDAPATDYADFILNTVRGGNYRAMALESLAAYHRRLSWAVNVARLKTRLETLVEDRARTVRATLGGGAGGLPRRETAPLPTARPIPAAVAAVHTLDPV